MRKKMKIIRKWGKVGKFVIHLLPIKLERTLKIIKFIETYFINKFFHVKYKVPTKIKRFNPNSCKSSIIQQFQRGVTINVFNILYMYIYIKYFCINYIKYPEAK